MEVEEWPGSSGSPQTLNTDILVHVPTHLHADSQTHGSSCVMLSNELIIDITGNVQHLIIISTRQSHKKKKLITLNNHILTIDFFFLDK